MNCLSCQRNLESDIRYKDFTQTEVLFKCSHCDFYHFVDKVTGVLTSYNFSHKIGKTEVFVYFNDNNTFEVTNLHNNQLFSLDYWPQLTPEAIKLS